MRFIHDMHRRALRSERTGGGDSHGEQQKEIHHEGTHPTAQVSACLGVASQHAAKCRERFGQLINPSVSEGNPMVSSAATSLQPAGDDTSTKQQRTTQRSQMSR